MRTTAEGWLKRFWVDSRNEWELEWECCETIVSLDELEAIRAE